MNDTGIVEITEKNTSSAEGAKESVSLDENSEGKNTDVSASKILDLADSLPEYKPPKIQQISSLREYSFEGALDHCINYEGAELIDAIISSQRELDSSVSDEVTAAIKKTQNHLIQLHARELGATVDTDNQDVVEAFSQIEKTPKDPLDITVLKTTICRLKELKSAEEVVTTQLENVRRWHERNVTTDLSELDERQAREKEGGFGHKIKFALSSGYRANKTDEHKTSRLEQADQTLLNSEKSKISATLASGQAEDVIGQLFTGGIELEESLKYVETLTTEFWHSRWKNLDDKSDEALVNATQLSQIWKALDSFKKLINGNIQTARESRMYEEVPEQVRKKVTVLLEKIDTVTETEDKTLENVKKTHLKEISDSFCHDIYEKGYDCNPYNGDLFRYKSDELRYVPTVAELQMIKKLIEDGVEPYSLLEVFLRSRARLELVARADGSYISHTTNVDSALMIIESGAIMSPDMVAGLKGGDPRQYSHSPAGSFSALMDEAYMTLNDYESSYLSIYPKDPTGRFGAIFVGNFGEIGQTRDWYWQQNSQSKPQGAEEVIIRLGKEPLSIDPFYIVIKDDPEVIKLYTDHLLKSGKSQEWIDGHLLSTKNRYGSRDDMGVTIQETLREKGITGRNKRKLYIPRFIGNITGGTHGNTDIASFRLQEMSDASKEVDNPIESPKI